MPGPYVTLDALRDRLAAWLQLKDGRSQLEAFWSEIAEDARQDAYVDLLAALCGSRGYTIAQIDTWDARVSYNLNIALYYCLTRGEYDTEIAEANLERLDWRPRLLGDPTKKQAPVQLTSGGTLLLPTGLIGRAALATTDDPYVDTKRETSGRVNPWEPGGTT